MLGIGLREHFAIRIPRHGPSRLADAPDLALTEVVGDGWNEVLLPPLGRVLGLPV